LIVLLVEELHDRLRHDRADALDAVDFGKRGGIAMRCPCGGIAQRGELAEMAGEQPCIGLADMADPERVDEAVEVHLAARLDGGEKVVDVPEGALRFGERLLPLLARFLLALPRKRLPLLEDHLLQRLDMLAEAEDVGGMADEAGAIERLDLLRPEAVDVEGVAADEVDEALHRLRRADQRAGAAADGILAAALGIDLAHRLAVADRAADGESVGLRI